VVVVVVKELVVDVLLHEHARDEREREVVRGVRCVLLAGRRREVEEDGGGETAQARGAPAPGTSPARRPCLTEGKNRVGKQWRWRGTESE
jgi:hypothetical protein